MKFNVDITIKSVEGRDKKLLKFVIEFTKIDGDYGNGYHMSVSNRDSNILMNCFDIRYDTNFDPSMPEVFIAMWAYNNWTGQRGSYDIDEMRIKHIK